MIIHQSNANVDFFSIKTIISKEPFIAILHPTTLKLRQRCIKRTPGYFLSNKALGYFPCVLKAGHNKNPLSHTRNKKLEDIKPLTVYKGQWWYLGVLPGNFRIKPRQPHT